MDSWYSLVNKVLWDPFTYDVNAISLSLFLLVQDSQTFSQYGPHFNGERILMSTCPPIYDLTDHLPWHLHTILVATTAIAYLEKSCQGSILCIFSLNEIQQMGCKDEQCCVSSWLSENHQSVLCGLLFLRTCVLSNSLAICTDDVSTLFSWSLSLVPYFCVKTFFLMPYLNLVLWFQLQAVALCFTAFR